MSQLYPDLNFTNFPNSVDNIELKSNITNVTDANLVNQIQQYIIAGDFVNANALINANPQLRTKIFNADTYNALRDAILAVERFYKNDVSIYVNQKQIEWEAQVNQFNFVGTYSPSTQYQKNNMVNYTVASGTFLYLCTQTPPNVAVAPSNTSYWRVLTLQGERGATGDGFAFTWLWSPTTNYTINNVVVSGTGWWVATQANIGQQPTSGSAYWTEILTALPAEQIPVTASQPQNQILGDQWYQVV